MNEYDSIIKNYNDAGPALATTALDADPERATRALQLSRATGVPPLAIHNDLDRFEEDHKANLTANIVRGNSQISSYIRGNALADHVSNDDYGNLDEASRSFTDALDSHPIWGKGVPKRYIAEPLMEGLKGAIYGAAEGFTQEPFKVPENYSALSKGAYDFLGIPLRGLNAVAGGFMGGAGGLARQATLAVGGDENQATRAEREARGIVESEMGRGGSGLQHADHAIGQVVRQNEALAVAKPWLDAGVDVPRGVHPLIDDIKVKTNDAWVDKIQTALDQAQNSLTKERDPELFKNFAQQHFEDAQMGISGDRVATLYGDKVPEPGDGLLGWVPGIAEKLEAAKTFGEDVHVPLSDWVTYMDPTLARELKDDIRAWPGGITKNEAALKDIAAPAIDGALPQVRTSAALEPMFAIGDRPVKLVKMESKFRGAEEYNFVDHNDKVIGDITLVPDPMKKQLYVAMVGTSDLKPNTMGPSLMRDIKRQLKELYPEYETITGMRVSGAREAAGVTDKSQMKPVVKLALSDAFEMSKEYTDLRNILDTAPTKFGDVTADIKPTELYTKHEQAIGQAVQEEINRITGKTAEPVMASDIRYEGIDGIRGVYHKAPGEVAKILVSLGDFDATGIARHEAIHHLYREGFFKPEEWNALIEASKSEGWRERYGIDARYEHLNELGLHEEAIAEAFRDWAKTREQQPINPVTTVFQKIWDLMQRIKDRVAKILGREPTFNELFEQAYSGELAQRELAERSREKIQTDLGENVPGALFSVSEEPTKKGFVAYHGSPYEFDKFDASKIGTGEGAQAYGHGLYFAEKEGIAKGYQEKLAKKNQRQAVTSDSTFGNVPILETDPTKPGALYQVHIKADPAKFLDWDKPLEQQKWIWDKLPEDLKAAIDDAIDARGHNPMSEVLEEYTGKDLYRALTHHEIHESIPAELPGSSWNEGYTTEKIHTAKFLESLGVEGVQYLDAGSRRKGDGTRNYVVFNDKNVEITHKNGKPVNEPPPFAKGESPQEQQLKAEAAGLDAKSFKKIQDLIQRRYQEDIAAAVTRAEKEQRTIQSKEWKEQAREVRKESEADVRARPDVQADLLIGSGELGGKKLERRRYELRSEDLSPEQKANLPRHYYAKDGVPVDVMANLFGYSDGNHLIEALAEVNKGKEGRSAQENLKHLIDEETNRRMEAKFGKLQDNIMLDAMDQALSETNLQILAEEWQGAAMAAGVKVVDKNIAKDEALRMFGDMKLADINVERLLGIMGKIGRDTERMLIAGKNADALVQMQRKYMTGLIAAEARKLQKEQATFERTAKQFSKREVPSVDPEYTNYVHQILMQIGKPVRRSIQDLQAQIEGHGSKNLEEFVGEKASSLREIPVWDQLFDTNWNKNYDSLTTTEFRAVHDSIKALAHNGRDELKIMKQGEAEDLAIVKQQMIQNVVDAAKGKFAEQNKGQVKKILMNYYVGHLQMENIFNRWDGFDSKGVWNQYIMRDLIDGANQKDAWLKEYAAKVRELSEPEGLIRTIDNPLFKDQDTGATLPLTRKNLIAVMLNTGNSSNLAKLAKGYKIEPNDVMSWVHQHATKKDWEYVQGVWDMFADIKSKADTMYRSLTGGVAPENIPIRPVDTPHGQFKGGYYPVIYHAEMEGKSKTLMGRDPLEQDNFVRATTPAGYTKTRTGYAAPMALELDAMPGRIGQMLHDIALRPAVLNAAKVFYDHDVRSAIRAHFGAEYRDELVPYLRGVANAANYESKSQMALSQASEFIRQNMITTLVGLNPGTVMKHGPTAAVLSVREVGAGPMAKAVRGLFSVNEATGESNWQFAIQNSLELQRRDRNWAETLYGSATGVLSPGDKVTPFRQKIMEWSSKPVALSDMISAVPTWLAKYEAERSNGASHGDAVYEADRSVRRAHGSTAITTRTAMMRNSNPWLVSIYNFFSDVMNRQMETIWKAGETKDLVKQGEWKEAAKTVPALTASLFAYAIWPAIVETYVSPHPHKDDDSWARKAAVSMGFALGSSWVGVRDVASAMAMGRDPQFGLTGTTYQTMVNTFKDLAKNEPFNKEHAGKILQDAGIMVGGLTGMLPAQVSKAGRFAFDVSTGKENPRNTWQWLTGLRYGTTDKHPANFTDYMKGKH